MVTGRTRTKSIAVALAIGLGGAAALAQAIYRCGDTYSQQRCDGGREIPEAAPSPSPAERAQAQAATQRDAALAESLEKDRLRMEAQAPRAFIPPPKAEAAPQPRKSPEKAATRKLDVFTASAPGSKPRKEAKAKPEKKKPKKNESAEGAKSPTGPSSSKTVAGS